MNSSNLSTTMAQPITFETFDLEAYCGNATESLALAICTLQDSLLGMTNQTVAVDATDEPIWNRSLIVVAGALVFFMQVGYALRSASFATPDTITNILMNHLAGACLGALVFYYLGFAVAFGGSDDSGQRSFSGNENWALRRYGSDPYEYAIFFFHYTMAVAATAIVAGTVGERCKLAGYLLYILFFVAFVYPIAAHAVWDDNGFLSSRLTTASMFQDVGFVDMAGSGVIHVSGGITALMTSKVVGPRVGRFYDGTGQLRDEPLVYPNQNVSMQLLGTFILWLGWLALHAGSTLWYDATGYLAALSVVTATLSGAAGCLSCVVVDAILNSATTGHVTYDLSLTLNGCLAGLVAISAGCAVVEPWAAIIIGGVGGIIYFLGSRMLIKLCVDDAVDGIPVHLGGGMWGVVAVGLFADGKLMNRAGLNGQHEGIFYELFGSSFDFNLLIAQVVGLAFLLGWSLIVMTLYMVVVSKIGLLRVIPVDDKAEPEDESRPDASENDTDERERANNSNNDIAIA